MINLIPQLRGCSDGLFEPAAQLNLVELQEKAAEILPVFTKCKQCRADAEGIPGGEA